MFHITKYSQLKISFDNFLDMNFDNLLVKFSFNSKILEKNPIFPTLVGFSVWFKPV